MEPRTRQFIGAGLLALILLGLVAIIFFSTVANCVPESGCNL